MARIYLTACTALITALICGCGPGTNPNAPARITGKVTYKGAAVGGGSIMFHPKSGGVYPGTLSADGEYTATDLPAEEMTVTVDTELLNPAKKKQAYGDKGKDQMYIPPGVQNVTGNYVKIPPKYADKKTSDLTITISPGKQTKDLELKD